jgi:parallel beta-helix repeat protein
MYSRNKFRIGLLLFSVLIGAAYIPSGITTKSPHTHDINRVENSIRPTAVEYQPHSSIFIDDNGDFASLGFSGSGTETNPYLIEGYNITSSNDILIEIRNTNVYFELRNMLLNGLNQASQGILLSEVTNGLLFSNYISNVKDAGIEIGNAMAINILNNTIFQNNALGPGIGGVGISIFNSSDNNIRSNFIFENSGEGIMVLSSSRNLLDYNTIFNNELDGILVMTEDGTDLFAVDNIFEYNSIYDNSGIGIRLGENTVIDNLIRFNVLSTNNEMNMELRTDSNNITIVNNDFINNDQQGDGQAVDNGTTNLVNNNYWSHWISPDIDGDGIVDNPFILDGDEGNADFAPLVEPNDPDLTYDLNDADLSHIIPSKILQPNPDERRLGVISIEWTKGIDTRFHVLKYSVYYSSEDTSNWHQLSSEITETSYLWDTRTVGNGDYLIKIVQTDSIGLEIETVMESSFKIVNLGDIDSNAPDLPLTDFYVLLFTLSLSVIIKKRCKSIK